MEQPQAQPYEVKVAAWEAYSEWLEHEAHPDGDVQGLSADKSAKAHTVSVKEPRAGSKHVPDFP